MGGLCSTNRQDSSHAGMDAHELQRSTAKLVNNPRGFPSAAHVTSTLCSNVDGMANKYDVVDALDRVTQDRRGDKNVTRVRTVLDGPSRERQFKKDDREHYKKRDKRDDEKDDQGEGTCLDYHRQRAEVIAREASLSWEYICKRDASPVEEKANRILQAIKKHDDKHVYEKEHARRGYRGQEHKRFMGDHFLYNVDLINKTELLKVAKEMPKGAHLHIHFNANLQPDFLLNIAKDMERMFITSDIPLVPVGTDESEPGYYGNFDRCRIRFTILSEENEERTGTGDIFDPSYPVEKRKPMKFQTFLEQFGKHYKKSTVHEWLVEKVVFHEEEAHGWLQTQEGAWEWFNARTQMMKGLFNYEPAYRMYTRQCLRDFAADGIQYAEIRVNFMASNQLWTAEGERLAKKPKAGMPDELESDNEQILKIIIDECQKFKSENASFKGIKVIYCTPRSFAPEEVQKLLRECLEFKRSKEYGSWIAGFDLVGEEGAKRYPIKHFIPQLLQFRENCRNATPPVEIPFLFHCGETLDMGDDTPDGNLYDALLLGAKRIGHGYALARHPYVMEQMKRDNICLELCPISNEILGLTPRVKGHAMYNLLANNVHCTVNTDNGTFFKSTLSHDFYQVFAGKSDMTLFGWKQLALWSIEHSCMDGKEKEEALTAWKRLWDNFCVWIIEKYSHLLDTKPEVDVPV